MVRFTAVACVLTACSSGAGEKPSAIEPPPTKLAQKIDAGVPVVPDPPKLACEQGTTAVAAPAPEPTWACTRTDGVRHGSFITLFPDNSIEIKGTYKDGALDGAWERHHPEGKIALEGSYAAGKRTGKWTQRSTSGAVLGEFEMTAGTGTEKKWLDDGVLYSETPFKDGVLEGVEKVYAHDGTQIASSKYKAGKLDGPHWFGTKNTLRFEETFVAGVRRGRKLIYQQGGLLEDSTLDRAGRLDGPYSIWRSAKVPRVKGEFSSNHRVGAWVWNDRDGKKEREGSYKWGRRDGEWNEWEQEKLTWSGTYDVGKPNGTFTYWDKAGNEIGKYEIKDGTGWAMTYWSNKKVSSKQHLYKGVEDGPYQEFTRLGKMVLEAHYASGIRHGRWREWTQDGQTLTLDQTFKKGKLDGAVKKYVDGKLSMEITYAEGKAEGPYVEYRAGKPSVTGQFAQDQKTGTWTHYNADGNVVRIATYKEGVLDGAYKDLANGVVSEGTMVAGRRSGTWTRTEKGGVVRKITYRAP